MRSEPDISSRRSSISPPPKRRRTAEDKGKYSVDVVDDVASPSATQQAHQSNDEKFSAEKLSPTQSLGQPNARLIASPVQLNFIEELPPASNVDTISLGSILGDVMIKECWLFNYLFDLDFVMGQFDHDVRTMIRVHVVHGSWRKEDSNRISMDEAVKRYPNVDLITAFMPEAFGTHHSKMMILFRHDDLAQVVILTGNFIARDWSMSQAIWRSPLLPLLHGKGPTKSPTVGVLGSGLRFKHDLIAYLKAYGSKLKKLIADLGCHDFKAVKAALVASTPGKQNLRSTDPDTKSLWGWPRLKHVLGRIPKAARCNAKLLEDGVGESSSQDQVPHIVIQVSSVASVGEKWLSSVLYPALCHTKISDAFSFSTTIPSKSQFSIIFPTADTIRKSVNGYGSGASIHMKTQTAAQAKQLSDIRPMLCHWAANTSSSTMSGKSHTGMLGRAKRGRAAPHIKTYVRFQDDSTELIDWAMVTSANLSTQAWGSAISATGEVRTCSYEIGVVFWPALWDDESDGRLHAQIVPTFDSDMPPSDGAVTITKSPKVKSTTFPGQQVLGADEGGDDPGMEGMKGQIRVGWRMPYDLPLVPYSTNEMPWCATEPCTELDWMGRVWPGYAK